MSRTKRKTVIQGKRLEKYVAEGKTLTNLIDGKVLFVTGGVPGDVVDILIKKDKKSYAEGKVIKVIEPSAERVQPFCKHFGICGGCTWQMLTYQKQLEYKQQQVADQLQRIGKINLPPMEPIIGCEKDRLYRNKLEFTFSELKYFTDEEIALYDELPKQPALGFHAPGRFDKVVDIEYCHLQNEPTNKIKNLLREWTQNKKLPYYNSRTKEGWLRNLIIRLSTTGEVLVNLIVADSRPELTEILDFLKKEVPEITSLHYTINSKFNDTIYDLPVELYHGKGFIEERLGEFKYKISPKSFFQTNSYQAKKLYDVVKDFAGLKGTEIVYDLYCGTGSIGIYLSHGAKKIIGVETVEDAVKDAEINASLNSLDNCLFFAGDVSKVATDAFFEEYGRPDVVITDPPRPGMSEEMIRQLLKIKAPKIVYVSCNPATQARDLQLMDEWYKVLRLQPVDMFPQTTHIENVALLQLRKEPKLTDESE